MLAILSNLKSIVGVGFVVMALYAYHQHREIQHQEAMIANLLNDRTAYEQTIEHLKTNKRESDLSYQQYQDDLKKSDNYYGGYSQSIDEQLEEMRWAKGAIPDAILCLLHCMHDNRKNVQACDCHVNAEHTAKLFDAVRTTQTGGQKK